MWRLFVLFFLLLFVILMCSSGFTEDIKASWYSVESCKREGTSGVMANGRKLNDVDFTCASWFYSFGDILRITNLNNRKSVEVEVTDRGPYKTPQCSCVQGEKRTIDLSKAAFKALAPLCVGVIPIRIEVIK